MPSLAAARIFNAAFAPSYTPLGVFVGGTAGIGRGIVETFARNTKGNAHILIVGRNRAAALKIIATFPKPTVPGIAHEFIECDLTLLKNVQRACAEILVRFQHVNFLVLTAGGISLKGLDLTEEGVDRKMALMYYGRWKFIHDLLPGLRAATAAGEDAKVMSMLSAGNGPPIDVDDLGLKKNFTIGRAMQMITYQDVMVENFAAREPSITFIHSYPGWVRTNLLGASDSLLLKVVAAIATPMNYLAMSPATCGEYQLYALRKCCAGAHRTGQDGESIGKKGYNVTDEVREKLWMHSVETVEGIAKAGV